MTRSLRYIVAVAIVLSTVAVARRPWLQGRQEADNVTILLSNLEAALASGRVETVRALAPALSGDDTNRLAGLMAGATSVTLRERARDGNYVLADILVTRGLRGRLSQWAFGVAPRAGRFDLIGARELGAFGGLLRLELDETTQFDVRNLRITGTDFELTIPDGSAFAASADGAPTALVLGGKGLVRFTPPIASEQDQLRIVTGDPAFAVETDDVFVRLSPSEFAQRIAEGSLRPRTPDRVDRARLRRALDVFEARTTLSFHVSAADLDARRWSLEPAPGNLLVDFHSGRFGWLTYTETPESAEDIMLFDRARRRQISSYASPTQRTKFGAFYEDDADESYVVTHTELDLTFAPDRRWLGGRASVRVTMRRADSTIRLRLAPSLVIGSVTSDLGSLLVLRSTGQDNLVLGLPEPLPAGRVFEIELHYHGRLEPQAIDADGPPGGTTTLGQPANGPTADTHFLYSTREAWYPQGAGQGHATARTRLTVPAEYSVLATGELVRVDVSEADGSRFGPRVREVRTFEHVADRPVRYLAFLAARVTAAHRTTAVFRPSASDPNEATVDVRVLPGTGLENRGPAHAAHVRGMVEHFGSLLGGAPYPSLLIAVLEAPLPGGHSPAYFSLIGQPPPLSSLQWSGDPVSFREAPDFFLAHEVAHQWWGQAVGPKNYHEQWISEGFAQYFAWLYVNSVRGPGVGTRIMSGMRETALEASHEGPIYLGSRLGHLRRDGRAFRAVVYNKSAVVLHTLRRLIGDPAFFAGARRLYTEHRFTRIGTDDVQRAFEVESGRALGPFFERWVMGSEVPEVRLTRTETVGGGAVRVDQLGAAFEFPLDLALRYADGRRERLTVSVTRDVEEFRLPAGSLTRVRADDPLTLVRVRGE